MTTEIICYRAHDRSPLTVRWAANSPITDDYVTSRGTVSVKHGHLVSGKCEGVEVVMVDTGDVRALLLPGRGMGIWKIWSHEVEFGWNSPVDGPVHPSLVPVMDPSGLGWLEGFDELVVRCGLESNGAPEKDDHGVLRYPLHGRVANLPARDLKVHVNHESGLVELSGEIHETRLFFNRLHLHSRIGFHANSSKIQLVDEVTNQRSVPATMQMLYHINVGSPVLAAGAKVELPIETLVPKDSLSAAEIDRWNEIDQPETGYVERVYFANLRKDDQGWTSTMIRGANDQIGFGVRFDAESLPWFIVWKNPAAQNDGFVVGLEPATNLPNGRSFETNQGRVVTLAPNETKVFRIQLCPLVNADAVGQFAKEIGHLAKRGVAKVLRSPKSGWTAGA